MTATLLISLRETLETSLIVGIILAALHGIGQDRFRIWVWLGVAAGVLGSAILGIAFQVYAATLSGEAREVYEGVVMLIAAGLILWMVVWMSRNARSLKETLHQRTSTAALSGEAAGVFLLSFTSTMREGTEMVIFLHATLLSLGMHFKAILGIVLGIAAAILFAFLLFRGLTTLRLRLLMRITSVLLLILAVSMIFRGIHDLSEVMHKSRSSGPPPAERAGATTAVFRSTID